MWRSRKVFTNICESCGQPFETRRKKSAYCSMRCHGDARRLPEGAVMSKRTRARRRKEQGLSRPAYYPFNEAFFHTWSDDLAWLLGVIWSDGCLKGDSVEVVSKDRDLIEAIVTLIGQEDGVKKRKGAEAWYVFFTSREVADWLRSLGLTGAKSLTAPFPSLPPAYEAAFVRGLIDGDGSVHLSSRRPGQQVADLRVRLVGASPSIRDGFCRFLEQYGIPYHASYAHDRVWQVTVTKQESLRLLYRLLYPTPEVSALARKRQPFDLWMATPRARSGRK